MIAAPDYAEPILGWRLWLVAQDNDSLHLESVVYEERWPIRQPLVASCLRGRRSEVAQRRPDTIPHAAPVAACHCGVYATSELDLLAPYLEGRYPGKPVVGRVVGVVSLWGSVVACDRGWRASNAYPSLLYLSASGFEHPHEIAERLTVYGIPVELVRCNGAGDALRALRREPVARRISAKQISLHPSSWTSVEGTAVR